MLAYILSRQQINFTEENVLWRFLNELYLYIYMKYIHRFHHHHHFLLRILQSIQVLLQLLKPYMRLQQLMKHWHLLYHVPNIFCIWCPVVLPRITIYTYQIGVYNVFHHIALGNTSKSFHSWPTQNKVIHTKIGNPGVFIYAGGRRMWHRPYPIQKPNAYFIVLFIDKHWM